MTDDHEAPLSREARRAQRKAQDALRRANAVRMPSRRHVADLGGAAGDLRRAMSGNSRYTPPARRQQRR